MTPNVPLFRMGQTVSTPNALEQLTTRDIISGLNRHARGDWGEVDADDKQANDNALLTGGRLLSSYTTETGLKFWIITEADRSVTTVTLPSEY